MKISPDKTRQQATLIIVLVIFIAICHLCLCPFFLIRYMDYKLNKTMQRICQTENESL